MNLSRNRPSWTKYFLEIAKTASIRSHDVHTQVGCVITDRNHRILGVGYNGFPRGMDDSSLPTSRPEKYRYMYHAERNALANCLQRPDDGVAYVTMHCCHACIMALWQHGIKKVYMIGNKSSKLMDEEELYHFNLFLEQTGMEVVVVNPVTVAVSGYFNPLHSGHLGLFEDAAKLGDRLVVIVNNDYQVSLKGGKQFMHEDERCTMVRAIKGVDDVMLSIDNTRHINQTLLALKPDIFANGGDVTVLPQSEIDVCEALNTKMVFGVGGCKIQSSSQLLQGLLDANSSQEWTKFSHDVNDYD